MPTYTTEQLRDMLSEAESIFADARRFVGFTVQFAELISVASEFMEWCADHKGGVLLFEFLCDTNRADAGELDKLLRTLFTDETNGGE
jgi:hypothetical protein